MWFYVSAAIVVIVFLIWFSRTNLFRAHRHGHGRDPGEQGTRMEGKFPPTGGRFND